MRRPLLGRDVTRDRSRRAVARAVLAASTGLLASGCALLTATPPEVEATRVELRGLGLLEQQLAVTLCATNPNGTELDFRLDLLTTGGALLADVAAPTGTQCRTASSSAL